jgi:hypothetical protein
LRKKEKEKERKDKNINNIYKIISPKLALPIS